MDRLSDYDYVLPDELIAQEPLEDRAASRLLHLELASGAVRHRKFREVLEILAPGDLLVANNTRVTALRLFGEKASPSGVKGAKIEALLIQPVGEDEYLALLKPAKRVPPGSKIHFSPSLVAEVEPFQDGPLRKLRFRSHPNLQDELFEAGQVPLPPYIVKPLADPERYQTIFATQKGSAAAPTAGLHFTDEIIGQLKAKGVRLAEVNLNISIDTFRPVMVENLENHVMHGETCSLMEPCAEAVAQCRGRIVAIGTTSVRTLESFATGPRQLSTGTMESKLFIRPGYQYKVIDGMFTNFHMPKTTMLCMISALAGRDRILAAYQEAVREKYRFLSLGDSMLLL